MGHIEQMLSKYLGSPICNDEDKNQTWMDYLVERDREQGILSHDYKQWDVFYKWKNIPFRRISAPEIDRRLLDVRLPPKYNRVIQESDEDYNVDENEWRRFMSIAYE